MKIDRAFEQRLEHADHKRLWAYWRSKAPAGGIPARADLDPLDIPALLPRLALIDVECEEGRSQFRYRLAGTEIVARAGRDPTGKSFVELYEGAYLEQALATYREVVETRQPHLSRRRFPVESGRDFLSYDRLILPLARDHRSVDMLVLCTVFHL